MPNSWSGPLLHGSVLVVEDGIDVASLLVSHLTAFGCRVDSAGTGEAGLSLALANPPDVVTIDVRLPGMRAARTWSAPCVPMTASVRAGSC